MEAMLLWARKRLGVIREANTSKRRQGRKNKKRSRGARTIPGGVNILSEDLFSAGYQRKKGNIVGKGAKSGTMRTLVQKFPSADRRAKICNSIEKGGKSWAKGKKDGKKSPVVERRKPPIGKGSPFELRRGCAFLIFSRKIRTS